MKNSIFIILLICVCVSCDDDNRLPMEAGVVMLASPNCNDYIIEDAGGNLLKPTNLNADFQVDQLQIIFSYELTSDFHNCGFIGSLPIIRITSVRRR